MHWKILQLALGLILANSALGVCPPRWVRYREQLCLFLPATSAPALSWSEARIFCQDQRADLVVIRDPGKQMFLAALTGRAGAPACSHYWIGLAWQEAKAELTWVDGTPASQSWYSNWLQGHPMEGRCVQLVSVYAGQWRGWNCSSAGAFICEMPIKDAFPGSVRKARFRSHCYVFHFPSFREWRSWREAQSSCQESGGSLAVVHDEAENAFLSDAFPEDGWDMWIGLRLGTTWRWSDWSSPVYLRWQLGAPPQEWDQCAMLRLRPTDAAQHGTWGSRPCGVRPATEMTGFICQHRSDLCGPPEPTSFPLPGGMGPHATADVTFAWPARSTCSLALIGPSANGSAGTVLLALTLEPNATHVRGSLRLELGGLSERRSLCCLPFAPGLATWSFITLPDGLAGFLNHEQVFRLPGARGASFADLSALHVSGVTVVNASLEYRLSLQLHFPGNSALQLHNAVRRYLGNFTIGLWLRSATTSSPRMCLLSYALKWRRPEFALFLLSPSGLEFHVKGVVLFRGTHPSLRDGSWHHVAVAVSSMPGAPHLEVFVDGEPWGPHTADGSSFLQKGLSVGGRLAVGQLEEDGRGTSFYTGDLSEVNVWGQALSGFSARQLATSRTRWKYPGNVVSWAQLVARKPPDVTSSPPSEEPGATFLGLGLLRLRGKPSVLCSDPERSLVFVAPGPEPCARHALWGLQPNGRLRNVAAVPSCLLVAPDGASLLSSADCSAAAESAFRLLPDQRLQNLRSGLCLLREAAHGRPRLGNCAARALHFALDQDARCPRARGWRARQDKCLFLVLDAALGWAQALKFCQRFHGGSLVALSSPQDLAWMQEELRVSSWTGLYSSGSRGSSWRWTDGTPFDQALQRFVLSRGRSGMASCVLALPSGFLKAEPCQRPHRWTCQAPRQSDLYVAFPGRSFYGPQPVDRRFPTLHAAQRECTALGTGCTAVVSTATGHRLSLGTRLVLLADPVAEPAAAVHVKSACSPGYSGQDCQSMCPRCAPGLSCNPLTGRCDGFLHFRAAPVAYASLKCLPLGVWEFKRGVCLSLEHFRSRDEADATCRRYLGATAQKVQPPLGEVPGGPSGGERANLGSGGFSWVCQRAEDVAPLLLGEKLLVPLGGPAPWQRWASLREAQEACYLRGERCTGVLSLRGAHYTVAGTALAEGPGSGAALRLKPACSPGFCGGRCQRRCSPCLSTQLHNPLTGRCDGRLRCVRRFSPSCPHGLVHSRCPQQPGWWFWGGHCYYVEERRTEDWPGARAACRAYGFGVELLALGSAEEKAWVANMVPKPSWTGLNDADQDGTWTWAGGQVANLSSPWLAGVQLAPGGCLEVGLWGGGTLAVSPCSERKPWVCTGTWAPRSSCPTAPGWSGWSGSCYFWQPSPARGWHGALQACRRFEKTELLHLDSPQEKDWVCSTFPGSFWTGLSDLREESVFLWSTQEPVGGQVAQYLRDDPADGGLKDCVWLDAGTGLLHDARCEEERPFLCKAAEGLDRFEEWPGRGVAGDPGPLFPSAEGLAQARQACLLHRRECAAILRTGTGFYLLASTEGLVPRADSTLFVWTICAEGFAGPACRTSLAHGPRPACDCSGHVQTSAEKVCGVPVQACVDDCRRVTGWANCSACLPSCTEASVSQLAPEQLALVAMARWRTSRSLNLTAEDERDRGSASRIVYDAGHP